MYSYGGCQLGTLSFGEQLERATDREAGESPTEVRWGQPLRTVLPSSFFDFDFLPTPSWSPMGKAKQTFGGQRSVSYTGKYE